MRNLDITLHLPLDATELEMQLCQAADPLNQSLWHVLLLLLQGHSPQEIIGMTGYSAMWVYELTRRYETVRQYHEGVMSCYRFRLTTDGKNRIIAG